MSGFKATGPFTLVIISFVILLSAGILFTFYILNIATVINSAYSVEFSTNLNAMGTEALNVLNHQVDGLYNMDILGRDTILNPGDNLEANIGQTLDKIHQEYDMMVDYDIGFFYRYGDSKTGSPCGIEAPSNFFEDDEPRFILSWPGERPVDDPGLVTSLQGPRYIFDQCNCHPGMDFAFYEGTSIYATYPGEIEYADWHPNSMNDHYKSYGLYIRIRHWIDIDIEENKPSRDPDFYTYYAHLDEIPVSIREGVWVSSGDIIATSGNTGKSTGPHLHLELRNSRKQHMNPCTFLEDQPFECQYYTSRKPTYCGNYRGADKITFDIPIPGAISENGVAKTKAMGVLYKWE
jgi:murein DD-endopeptidase MepM/ murein hydrolase activator NlpD